MSLALIAGTCANRSARSQEAPDGSAGEALLPVAATQVRLQDSYAVTRAFTGRASARRSSALGFDRSGLVDAILVDDGEVVQAGQVLARLDTDRLIAEQRRLSAERDEVKANLTLARKTEQRSAQLVADGHQSQQRLDEDEARTQAFEASLARVDASLKAVSVDLEKAELIAPFDGTIQSRLVDEGTVLDAGEPALELLETGHMEAQIGLPYDFGRRLREGAAFDLLTPKDAPIPARLVAVTPGIRGETRTVLATIAIEPVAGTAVTDGALLTLTMQDRIDQAGFWTPLRSLSADLRGLWRIYTLKPDQDGGHRVAFENVQILYAEDARAFVTGSVDDGSLIVAAGVDKVAPGKRVRPILAQQADARG